MKKIFFRYILMKYQTASFLTCLILALCALACDSRFSSLASESNPGNGAPEDPLETDVTANLQATRLSGPAPLAVLFDAAQSTAVGVSIPFHQLHYSFNFGDDRGLTWAISGKPKNTQSGAPLASHVFDLPGTYTVSVRVTDPATNKFGRASVTITVTDPNTVYSGTNTICVSGSSNFTGCPSGALQQTALPAVYANKRVLLRSGETFATVTLNGTDDNVLVATFGTGSKPRVERVFLGGGNTVAAWPDEVTIMDLDIRNGFSVLVTGSRLLLYRCDMTDPNTEKIDIGTALGYYVDNGTLAASQYYWPREVFLVENNALGDTNNDNLPLLVVMGFFNKAAILGNTFNRATQHTLRAWSGYKAVLAHNSIGGEHYASPAPGIRAAIKFHSGGVNPYDDNLGVSGREIASRYLVSADNRYGSVDYPGSWTVGFAPQNTDIGTIEGIEDLIMERDHFLRGPYTSQDIHNVVRRATVRDQTVEGGVPLLMHQLSTSDWSGDPGMLPWIGPYFGMPNNY